MINIKEKKTLRYKWAQPNLNKKNDISINSKISHQTSPGLEVIGRFPDELFCNL